MSHALSENSPVPLYHCHLLIGSNKNVCRVQYKLVRVSHGQEGSQCRFLLDSKFPYV